MKKGIARAENSIPNKTALPRYNFSTFLHILVLIVLPAFIYYHTIWFDYTSFDDAEIIKNNTHILGDISIANIKQAFQSDAFLRNPGATFYRPLQTLSLILDGTVGSNKLWIYHLTNLLIHILVSVSVYFLLFSLRIPKSISFFCALLFSVHPLFASAVSWIPARGDLLIALEGIWLFIAFSKHISTGKVKYFWVHILLFLLIAFTKETGMIFPFFLVLYYRVVPKKESNLKRLVPYIIAWGVVILLNLIVRSYILTKKSSADVFGLTSFIKNIPAIPITIGKFFIPQNLATLALYDTLSLIIGIAFLALIIFVFIKSIRNNQWVIVMAFAWFLLFTLPPLFTSVNVFADYYFQYLEHRTYLPSIGIVIIIASLLQGNIHKYNTYLINTAATVSILLFSILAYSHSNDYKDAIAFNTAAIESSPTKNAYAYSSRGIAYFNAGNYAAAMEDLDASINILDNHYMYYNRGYVEMVAGNNEQAEKDFSKAMLLKPDFIAVYINRALVYDGLREYDKALADINQAEKMDQKNDMVFCRKGAILFHKDRTEEAVENFSKSIILNPGNFEALNKRARAYYKLKKYNLAIEDSRKLLSLNVENDIAYNNLGLISLEMKNYDDALNWFTKAINTNSNLGGDVYFNRARAALKIDKQLDACNDFGKAAQLGFAEAKDSLSKYCK